MLQYVPDELRLIGRGARIADRVRLAAMSARLHLESRGVGLPGAQRELDVRLDDETTLRVRANDFVLFEVMGFGAYDIDLAALGPIDTVLDVGANIGLATIFLAARLPHAQFICAEPSARSYALLERNLRRNVPHGFPQRAAVTAEPTTVVVQEGSHPGRTHVARAQDSTSATTVRGITIPQLLDAAGAERADLMKLDIEGGERELLASAGDWADRVGAVLAEIHAPLTVEDAAEQLAEHGYRRLALPAREIFSDILLVAR
jgi:FkbM family methyltransferase